jgi:hypothetical protein
LDQCKLSDDKHRQDLCHLLDAATASSCSAACALSIDETAGTCAFQAIIGITTEEKKDEALRHTQRAIPEAEIKTVTKPSLWHLHNDVRKRKDFCFAGEVILNDVSPKEAFAKVKEGAKALEVGHEILLVLEEPEGKRSVCKMLGIYLNEQQAKEQHKDPKSSRYCENVSLMKDFQLRSTHEFCAPEMDRNLKIFLKVAAAVQTSKHFKELLHHADLQVVTAQGLEAVDSIIVRDEKVLVGTGANEIEWDDLTHSVQVILKQLIGLCFASL